MLFEPFRQEPKTDDSGLALPGAIYHVRINGVVITVSVFVFKVSDDRLAEASRIRIPGMITVTGIAPVVASEPCPSQFSPSSHTEDSRAL